MEEVFDFSTAVVGSSSDSEYVRNPGYYVAKITESKLVKPDTSSPYLLVTFETNYGKLSERFFVTSKALGRLKDLYEKVWARDLTTVFKSVDEVGSYFEAS